MKDEFVKYYQQKRTYSSVALTASFNIRLLKLYNKLTEFIQG